MCHTASLAPSVSDTDVPFACRILGAWLRCHNLVRASHRRKLGALPWGKGRGAGPLTGHMNFLSNRQLWFRAQGHRQTASCGWG